MGKGEWGVGWGVRGRPDEAKLSHEEASSLLQPSLLTQWKDNFPGKGSTQAGTQLKMRQPSCRPGASGLNLHPCALSGPVGDGPELCGITGRGHLWDPPAFTLYLGCVGGSGVVKQQAVTICRRHTGTLKPELCTFWILWTDGLPVCAGEGPHA